MERQEAGYTVADESRGSVIAAPPVLLHRRSRYHRLVMRPLAWLAGIVGIAALGRLLSRRRSTSAPDDPAARDTAAEEMPAEPADDPAEELRRRLAAKREPEATTEPEAAETLEERRARVHAKAREAMEAMNDEGPGA